MGCFVVWEKATKKIKTCLPDAKGTTFTLEALMGRFPNWESIYDGQHVDSVTFTTYEAKRYMSIDDGGNLVISAATSQDRIDELKVSLLRKVNAKYEMIVKGIDPETRKDIYVDCTLSDSSVIRMNTGENAAFRMDGGVRIIERSGYTEMPVVRDFYNNNHTNVPISDAILISAQQGNDALGYWAQKSQMVDAIDAATTVQELQAISITFNVNVE